MVASRGYRPAIQLAPEGECSGLRAAQATSIGPRPAGAATAAFAAIVKDAVGRDVCGGMPGLRRRVETRDVLSELNPGLRHGDPERRAPGKLAKDRRCKSPTGKA